MNLVRLSKHKTLEYMVITTEVKGKKKGHKWPFQYFLKNYIPGNKALAQGILLRINTNAMM